jgi:hypothetical protein
VAEVDVKLKDTSDGDLSCAHTAQVRGLGELEVVDEEIDWLIRSNSKLDGRKRTGILGNCDGVLSPGGACSVHRVNAGLKITAQGVRNNGGLKYDRFNLNQRDIFEAVEGLPPTNGEGVVLVCSCEPIVE